MPARKRATIDPTVFMGGGGGAAGAAKGAVKGVAGVTPDQGAMPDGTLLAKAPGRGITAPGRVPNIINNPYGPRIDFGPIFKPRSTGVDPLVGDPFKATDGVGGFFRRLLGDNADELNAQAQQQRIANQMADSAASAEQAAALARIDREHQNRLSEIQAQQAGTRSQAELTHTQAMEQMKAKNLAEQNAEYNRNLAAYNDPVVAANQTQLDADLRTQRSQAELAKTQAQTEEANRSKTSRYQPIGKTGVIQDTQTGDVHHPDDFGNYPTLMNRASTPAAGGVSDETRQQVKQRADELSQQNAIEDRGSAFGQASTILKEIAMPPQVAQIFPLPTLAVNAAQPLIDKGLSSVKSLFDKGPNLSINPNQALSEKQQAELAAAQKRREQRAKISAAYE